MTFVIFLGFAVVLSFIAMRHSFFGLKLMAGMSCWAFAIYGFENPPGPVTQGSGAHIAIVLVAIGWGIMVVLAGLGRGIEQTQDRTGAFSVKSSGGFKFQFPEFLKGITSSGEQEQAKQKRSAVVEEYRERMHNALNPSKRSK